MLPSLQCVSPLSVPALPVACVVPENAQLSSTVSCPLLPALSASETALSVSSARLPFAVAAVKGSFALVVSSPLNYLSASAHSVVLSVCTPQAASVYVPTLTYSSCGAGPHSLQRTVTEFD